MKLLSHTVFSFVSIVSLPLAFVLVFWPRVAANLVKIKFPSTLVHISTNEQVIALAIDDGPDPETSLSIGQLLTEKRVPATFFLIGERAERYPETVQRLTNLGHGIGAHFYEDAKTSTFSYAQALSSYNRTLAALEPYAEVTSVRPGYGVPSHAIEAIAAESGTQLVMGDVPALDTFNMPDWFYLSYLKLVVRSGSIVTFHDTGDRGYRTLRILPEFIDWAHEAGYVFRHLDNTIWSE